MVFVAGFIVGALLYPLVASAQIPVQPDQAWTQEDPEFGKYRSFVVKLDRFNRMLGGCPAKGLDMAACSPALGRFDIQMWKEMRKDAREVFDLRTP